ncbi:MAG: group I intron-associated PD-(D/E)XK endonuclease [Actinomycetes bacterium]
MTEPSLPPLPPGVDAEALVDAVARSRSWRGVLRSFGLTSTHKGRQMRTWCDAAGIDYSHFATWSWDRRALRTAVETSTSWPELIERLGIGADSGSARSSIRRRCLEQGIDLAGVESTAPSPADDVMPRCDLSRLRSAGGHLVAAYCTLAGWRVSWPLEPVSYDLLAEDAARRVRRIQVKTTTRRDGDSWSCGISRSTYVSGGGKVRATYEPEEFDDFGIVDGDLRVYLVPAALVAGRTQLTLRRYRSFELVVPPAHRS